MTLIEFSWTSLHLNNTIGLHMSLSKIESFDHLFVILSSPGFKKEVLNTIQEKQNLVRMDTAFSNFSCMFVDGNNYIQFEF